MSRQENFILRFVEWVRANEARLAANQIRVVLPSLIFIEGTFAEFFAESGEATVEMWEYGFSEFHVWLHRGNPQAGEVNTTHYEFQDFGEMYAALEQLVEQMTPTLEVGEGSKRLEKVLN